MLLVDTNIFIDYWKNPTDEKTMIFRKNEIAICGVIETELLRGSNSDTQFNKIKNAMECFNYLSFCETDWISLSKLFIVLKNNGLCVPFQDGVIAYLARKYECQIWTNDRHFELIKSVCPEIKLFKQ